MIKREKEFKARPAIVRVTVEGSYEELGPKELGGSTIGWIVKKGACTVDILDKDLGNISFDFVTPSSANLNVSNPQLCTCGRTLNENMNCIECDLSPSICTCMTCGICGGPIRVILGKKYCSGCRRPAYLCTRPPC